MFLYVKLFGAPDAWDRIEGSLRNIEGSIDSLVQLVHQLKGYRECRGLLVACIKKYNVPNDLIDPIIVDVLKYNSERIPFLDKALENLKEKGISLRTYQLVKVMYREDDNLERDVEVLYAEYLEQEKAAQTKIKAKEALHATYAHIFDAYTDNVKKLIGDTWELEAFYATYNFYWAQIFKRISLMEDTNATEEYNVSLKNVLTRYNVELATIHRLIDALTEEGHNRSYVVTLVMESLKSLNKKDVQENPYDLNQCLTEAREIHQSFVNASTDATIEEVEELEELPEN